MKHLLIIIITISLTGCFGFNRTKPIEVIAVEQERQRLELELPRPLSFQPAQWFLVTPDNVERVWQQLENDGKHLVLFAITSEGYEQLSMTMADIRNYIATQRTIIIKYQEYYESDQ